MDTVVAAAELFKTGVAAVGPGRLAAETAGLSLDQMVWRIPAAAVVALVAERVDPVARG